LSPAETCGTQCLRSGARNITSRAGNIRGTGTKLIGCGQTRRSRSKQARLRTLNICSGSINSSLRSGARGLSCATRTCRYVGSGPSRATRCCTKTLLKSGNSALHSLLTSTRLKTSLVSGLQ